MREQVLKHVKRRMVVNIRASSNKWLIQLKTTLQHFYFACHKMSFSGPPMSEDLKKVQDQLAQMMKQNNKQKGKKNDDFGENRSRDYQNNEEDMIDQRYKQVIQNSQNIPDVGLVDQTSDLMQNIIRVMKDQDLNNQLQILTDQELSKPITSVDLKNVINRMHQGITAEQQKMQGARFSNDDSRNISLCQSSILNKSANFGKSKSKSPALSSRTQAIICKKQKNGEYKPIYKRLDEIKQRHEETIMKTKGLYPKVEEPMPSFHPQINENTIKIMQNRNRQQQNWDEFLKDMKDWDQKKVSQIRQKQVEKEIVQKQVHTFHPVINRSTQVILEKSPSFKNDYDPQNMQNVVSRLYSRMKEKKQREDQRLKDSFSNSPFKPKINQNSEKLFFKMCNGVKVPLEERMKLKTPIKNTADKTSRNVTPQQSGKVVNTLDPIQEVLQSENLAPSFKNQGEQLNKSLQLQNSTISNKTFIKDAFLQNSTGLNQSLNIQKNTSNNTNQLSLSNCSFLNNNNNNNFVNTSNINNITIQTPENKKSSILNSSKSISLSKNKEKNPNNKSLIGQSTKSTNDTQKENNYHILITDGNISSQEDLKIKRASTIKVKPANSPQRASVISQTDSKVGTSNQKQNNQNLSQQNSSSNLVNSNRLSQSINLLSQKVAQKQEECNSPVKQNVNLTYNIRSPKLNHSPLKKSAVNYTMTVQNIKAQTHNLSSASKFEVLNTQISPLKDIDNQNDVEYGQNLKYIINLLKKEDPSFSQQKSLQQQSQNQNSQSSFQTQNKIDSKIQKLPQKKK